MININPDRTDKLVDALVTLWEASVRATHHFLNERDIQKFTPLVKLSLFNIQTLIVASEGDHPAAFMGISAAKIEMLFVLPDHFGKGIGRELTALATARYGVRYVDVNEQNPQATGFYHHIGFRVFERTETDQQRDPFPILKMRWCPFSTRTATHRDIPEIRELFIGTVLTINRSDYSQPEVEDWASCSNDTSRWRELIEAHYFIVAQSVQSQIVGFASITNGGYLHSLFVHKDFQNNGIGTLLLAKIEQYAKEKAITTITSEVSLTARQLFEKRGYTVQTEQKRQANHLCLTNFRMTKHIFFADNL